MVELHKVSGLMIGNVALSTSDFFAVLADRTLLEDFCSKDEPFLW